MSQLFTPSSIGPLTLRNRTIRSAAFESMCPGNSPSQELLDYHTSVAAGGVGMTTVAYAAVCRSGLSFDRQLWMRPEIVPGLRRLVFQLADISVDPAETHRTVFRLQHGNKGVVE